MLEFNCNPLYSFLFLHEGRPYFSGKETYSPEVESSPAPSSADPGLMMMGQPHSKQSSRGNSFEIENLLKTAGEVRDTMTKDIQSRDYHNQLGFH